MNFEELKQNRTVWIGAGCAVLVGVIVWFAVGRTPKLTTTLGELAVTPKDVEARLIVLRTQNPGATAAQAKEQMVRTFAKLELLKKFGMPLTEQNINQERERLIATAPQNSHLAKSIQLLGKDTVELRRGLVLPALADRILQYEYFLKKSPEQDYARKKAEAFLADYRKNPKTALPRALSLQFTVQTGTVTPTEVVWDASRTLPPTVAGPEPKPDPAKTAKPNPAEAKFWARLLSKMKEGEVSDALRPYVDQWVIVRLISRTTKKDGDTCRIEVIKAPQAKYDSWARAQTEKISVKVY